MNKPSPDISWQPNMIVSDLRARGYALLPLPRVLRLEQGDTRLAANCRLTCPATLGKTLAARSLRAFLAGAREARAGAATCGVRSIALAIRRDAVATGLGDGRHDQAYRMDIFADRVLLTGNSAAGLFYAVQTLLQLLASQGAAPPRLPLGAIVDWPEYELRCLHWDTKHHQDRLETLRRCLDQAAEFKINAVLFEIEDKFAYPSHPVIGAPGAFTATELQSLVDYGLERFIQIIPDVQGPAHMSYVLKHPEFAHLRCDGSNYQICMDDPAARRLLFDMYDDLCQATRGVSFFHVSTDEVYYAGICRRYRRPYNPENRSLTWVDYVNAAHAHLAKRGRRVIVWGEYPLLPGHVKLLPRDLLNGVGGRKEAQTRLENEQGIRQFVYTSMQGVELLFPNYFSYVDRDGKLQPSRLEAARAAMLREGFAPGDFIGAISAAWDDSGPHGETLWLGWGCNAQGSWTPGAPVAETVASFMEIFYGGDAALLTGIHREMQQAARFYEFTLERLPSKTRPPAYGDWDGKRPTPRSDRAMVSPALPDPRTLAFTPRFSRRYAAAIARVPEQMAANERLTLNLQAALAMVRRNRHNLEVYLSLAALHRHFVHLLAAVARAEDLLAQAARAARRRQRQPAARLLSDARQTVSTVRDELYATYEGVKKVWEKGRFPKGQSVDGRDFLHVMDDVKDHLGDRRPDLTYLISPVENIGLDGWLQALDRIIAGYVAKLTPDGRRAIERDPDE